MSGYESKDGALRSHEAPYYHLIPVDSIRREAVRWTLGAKEKGNHNWRKGLHDPEFVAQIINHVEEHWLKFKEFWASYVPGQQSPDDDLAAVKWGLSALMEVERLHCEALSAALSPSREPESSVPEEGSQGAIVVPASWAEEDKMRFRFCLSYGDRFVWEVGGPFENPYDVGGKVSVTPTESPTHNHVYTCISKKILPEFLGLLNGTRQQAATV